jgi:hypothetical protein
MKIDQKQVGDRKQVGTVDGKALHLIVTKGGLHILVKEKDTKGEGEILGAGPHVAIARHLARARAPNLKWTDLNKSDPVEYVQFEKAIPHYEGVTSALRKLHGDE